jgi:curved DNA-binding protein CbpA
MTDYFALLNEPRRPAIDPGSLKEKFFAASQEVHPDRIHTRPDEEKQAATARYAELNSAYNTLREPKDRLLHLLELENGSRPGDVQRIPPGTLDLFVEVGQMCRDIDAFLASGTGITSPLMKVQHFQAGMEWTDKLQALQQRVEARRAELLAELETINVAWQAAPPPGAPERAAALPLERLEQIYRMFSYINRWSEQIQERSIQLAAGAF